VNRVHRNEPFIKQPREARQLLDILARRGKEEAQPSNKVDTTVEEEAALIQRSLAP
jgi:hypothetical protein